MLSMEKIENLKKGKKGSGKIRTMTSSKRTKTPTIELKSVCDFYVFVNYLEFFGFNLIPHKKRGPKETRTQHFQCSHMHALTLGYLLICVLG
jgi:hypothetical protein